LGLLLLAACATKTDAPAPTPEVALVWPSAPAQPRIAFLKTFSRPEDLEITKGFFQRLGELFTGPSEWHMVRPMAVVAFPDGVIFVADPGAKGVHRFDPAKGRYDLIRGEGGKPLPSPIGLAGGPQGEIYVTDSQLEEVFVIRPGSNAAAPVPLKEKVEQPTGIALDPETGQLYVVDTRAHQVKVFGSDGTLRSTFGRRGTGDGEFNYPTLMGRDRSGRLLVTDTLNFRVQIFDGSGKFLGKFGRHGTATGDFSRPKGVAADRFGHVYVADSLFHAVQIFDLSGNFLLHFGSQGRGPGEFWLPTGIFLGESETIYIADSHNRRVQVFRYVGGPS
jgi:DNA-binding beta-propeller fold protein YncE